MEKKLNIFNTECAPIGEPVGFVINTHLMWRIELHIETDDVELFYHVWKADQEQTVNFPITAITDPYFSVDVSGSVTAGMTDGVWGYDLRASQISTQKEMILRTGTFNVYNTDQDRRTHAEVMLSKIEALLEKRAGSDIREYEIQGRKIVYMQPSELLRWRNYYQREVNGQVSVAIGEKPKVADPAVQVRF